MEEITLAHTRAAGDIVTMTALVRDIHLTYPGRFAVSVQTTCGDVWANNPYIVPRPNPPKKLLSLSYGESISRSSRECIHFLTAWHHDFQKKTGLRVPLLHPKPDLHLSEVEKNDRIVDGRYWLILSGGKTDFTTKHYVYSRHQRVVDALRQCSIPVVQAGAGSDYHPVMSGALNLIGRTNLREFMRLIYQSEGVICTITAAMHIAAAFDKPCVVTAGGRESWWWEGYAPGPQFGPEASEVKVPHVYLHTLGLLDCCRQVACWKNKVSHAEKDSKKSYCHKPVVSESGQRVPECMNLIDPNHIIEAVMSFYKSGVLPPIGPAPTIILPSGERLEAITKTTPVLLPVALPMAPPAIPLPIPTVRNEPNGNKAKIIPAPPISRTVFDHDRVGGKFTVCVLLYGDYFDMHRRCLSAILQTCPSERIDLRVGSNQLGEKSLDYVSGLKADGRIRLHYCHSTNERKYPVMREMFYDPACPIDTKWIIWFDDDSMCDKEKDWLPLLSQQIIQYPDVSMFGPHQFYTLGPGQVAWIKEGDWYRGRPFRDRGGVGSPNGTRVHFTTGSFWCLSTEAMRRCNIPDKRLGHNGGDWTIGEQLWQGGFKLKGWTGNKQIILWSSVKRRGVSEPHPGGKVSIKTAS